MPVATQKESQFQAKVLKYLRKEYPQAYIWKASDRFICGIPDIMMIANGQAIGIELKVGYNKPTTLQVETHKQMEKAGAIVGVAWTLDDVKSILNRAGL